MMNKKNIIIIACGAVAVAIIIAVILVALLSNKKNDNIITIEQYNEKMQMIKETKIEDEDEIEKINKICNNILLSQDEVNPHIGIRQDIKIKFNDGRMFTLQEKQPEYCYYENPNENIKQTIKMPPELFKEVYSILKLGE